MLNVRIGACVYMLDGCECVGVLDGCMCVDV